jgi:hypothetical protein
LEEVKGKAKPKPQHEAAPSAPVEKAQPAAPQVKKQPPPPSTPEYAPPPQPKVEKKIEEKAAPVEEQPKSKQRWE